MGDFSANFNYKCGLVGRRIRLLRIHPDRSTEPLRISLLEQEVDRNTPYLALSYVWGSPEVTKSVTCNGRILKITESLYAALRQLRDDERQNYIWVDAICINQADLEEKTEQVRMMGEIFRQAEVALIWLGEKEEDDQLGYDLMVKVCERFRDPAFIGSGPNSLPQSSQEELFELPAKAWLAMVKLLRRPWFWRTWVIQEYYLAREKHFQCGELIMDPDYFFEVTDRIGEYNELKSIAQDRSWESWKSGPPSITGAFFAFRAYAEGDNTLFRLLSATNGLQSSDKRDRIFSLIGVSSDADSSLIDYEVPWETLLIRLAVKILQHDLQLHSSLPPALDYLCFVNSPNPVDEIPSWVTAFDLPMTFFVLQAIFPLEHPLKTESQVAFGDNGRVSIRGRIFDKVRQMVPGNWSEGTGVPNGPPTNERNALLARKGLEWEYSTSKLAKLASPYPTGEDSQEVYWRSLVCNSADLYTKASPDLRKQFDNWRETFALVVVWFERFSGSTTPESSEDILCKLEKTDPFLNWRLLLGEHPEETVEQTWERIRLRLIRINTGWVAFGKPITHFSSDRRYFLSSSGYLGWVPRWARQDDLVCAFYGCRFPFVIRQKEEGLFQFIGACYMHGIMEEEAIELPNIEGDTEDVIITLV